MACAAKKSSSSAPRKRRKNRAAFLPGIVGGERVLVAQVPKRESEASLMHRIITAVAVSGALVWRNHVGTGKHANGNWVHMGLGVGSADLVGIVKSSRGVGVFLAIEVKRPGALKTVTREQHRWIDLVNRWGGVAGAVDSVEGALELVTRARGL
jgi:hypothetical protein